MYVISLNCFINTFFHRAKLFLGLYYSKGEQFLWYSENELLKKVRNCCFGDSFPQIDVKSIVAINVVQALCQLFDAIKTL